jgi:hypothetical protein
MSASHLSSILEQELNIKPADRMSFRNRLSKYLLKAGLQKKRFSDGFYYFGMKNKFDIKVSEKVKSIDEIMTERNKEFDTYIRNEGSYEKNSCISAFNGSDMMASYQNDKDNFTDYLGRNTSDEVNKLLKSGLTNMDKMTGNSTFTFIK